LQPVMDVVAASAARFCGATDATIYRLEGKVLRLAAAHGPLHAPIATVEASPQTVGGRTLLDRKAIHIVDLLAPPETEYPETLAGTRQRDVPTRTMLATPLLREGAPIGVIYMRRTEVRPFSDKQIALAKTFADQAVIAIENVRLFTELGARNRDLSVALDHQTATSEVLRVIGSSPTNAEPVFDAIVRSAVRLLNGFSGSMLHLVGDNLQLAAITSTSESGDEAIRGRYPRLLTDTPLVARAVR